MAEMEKVYAPDRGEDREFDEAFDKMWEALVSLGNPEKIEPDVARETFARRMVEYAGKDWPARERVAPQRMIPEPDQVREPIELSIPEAPDAAYWYDDPADAKLLEHYVLTRRSLGNIFHGALLITGPAGSGKTQGIGHAIDRINAKHHLSLRLMRMDCATVTDPQKWFGRREVDSKGTHYVKSDLIESVERGDVILLDDFNRIHPHIANPLFSLLDGSQSLHLSDLNVTIPVHPETVVIATMNEGAQFGGTHRMDWALRERFPFTIERDFPPADEEIKVITTHTGCDPDAAQVMVDIAVKSRDLWRSGDVRAPISTRTLVAAGWLVASGMTEREALEVTAVPTFDADASGATGEKSERMTIRAAIDARIGRRP